MKKTINRLRGAVVAALTTATITLSAQLPDRAVTTGPYTADWESLSEWECPEWFKDAKFGIWAHWGPQCQAESGDWYGRGMYFDGHWQNRFHKEHFGDPAEFGLKDLCNAWKAENWDPEKLVALYKSVGARYFFTLGQHHDNLDLWDSPYQEWNSVNVGPHKDIVKDWADACRKYGLPLGISMHGAHSGMFLEPSRDYDGLLTKEDGKGKWWDGLDPEELYGQDFEPSAYWRDEGSIHGRWDWQNTTPPTEKFKRKMKNRVMQCVEAYSPDMIYFDDTVLPFWGCDEQAGLDILADYYNQSAKRGGTGRAEVVAMGKKLHDSHKEAMLWDVERGVPAEIQKDYWQTCTCIGSWHYDRGVYTRGHYKSAARVIAMLMDIVSKNGNLLLSIPVRGDGTLDEKELAILADIKAWLDVNGEGVYGTRPWRVFGEGPTAQDGLKLSAQGFNERNDYSAADVRYTKKGDSTLYATLLGWPDSETVTFRELAHDGKRVKKVELLGCVTPVEFAVTADGLSVTMPAGHARGTAPMFKITL